MLVCCFRSDRVCLVLRRIANPYCFTSRYRSFKVTGLFVVSGFLYVVGFAFRINGAFGNYDDLGPYIVSVALIYVSPYVYGLCATLRLWGDKAY